jgi:hypothetical protein
MPKTINLVFSEPPPDVSDEEFNRWYDEHLDEILSVPGFVSAQRFQIEPWTADPDAPAQHRFLAVFELDGDLATIMAEMERMKMSRPDLYIELKKTDTRGPAIPEWWDRIRWASWHCVALGDRVEAQA